MKEFEKWDKRNKLNYGQFSGGEFSVKNERRKGWKAALEWILAKKVSSAPCKTPLDVLNGQIKEELEGE